MRVGDAVDELIRDVSARSPAFLGALAVLNAAFERCAGDFHGGGEPCARQMSGEAVANVRASLVAALAAFDAARVRFPSGPVGIVSASEALAGRLEPAVRHSRPDPQETP